MKRTKTMLGIMALAILTFMSCDKSSPIVEEDLNGFDTQQEHKEDEGFEDRKRTNLIGASKNSRSSYHTVWFYTTGLYNYGIYKKINGSWDLVYYGNSDNVGFSLPYHPDAYLCGRGNINSNWAFLPYTSGCKQLLIEYVMPNNQIADTDKYNCQGYASSGFRVVNGIATNVSDLVILEDACGKHRVHCP